MKDIKCSDCEEYRNEWCEKIVDSPHQDITRDCQYWHKRKDMIEVIRCKDCKNSEHWYRDRRRCFLWSEDGVSVFDNGFCNYAERRRDEQTN